MQSKLGSATVFGSVGDSTVCEVWEVTDWGGDEGTS